VSAITVPGAELRPFLKVSELARFLNVTERTVFNLLSSGALPSYKVKGARRIDPRDVDRYLERNREH
jgi:excisionase family DNA binding protein